MTTVCCKCQKTKTANGWLTATPKTTGQLSHGYCPPCHGEEIEKIKNHRLRRANNS